MSYDGKVAIVTGGAGGMGSVMSLALARAGLKVAVVDINAQSLNRLVAAAAAAERLQDRVRPFAVDIGDRAAVEERRLAQAPPRHQYAPALSTSKL